MSSNKSEKNKNQFLPFIGLGVQMAVTIYLFRWVGEKLDARHLKPETNYAENLVLVGVLVSIVSLILQLKRINKE
jgi:uncharacterized membrane protein